MRLIVNWLQTRFARSWPPSGRPLAALQKPPCGMRTRTALATELIVLVEVYVG
jgi:hypothetical protein